MMRSSFSLGAAILPMHIPNLARPPLSRFVLLALLVLPARSLLLAARARRICDLPLPPLSSPILRFAA